MNRTRRRFSLVWNDERARWPNADCSSFVRAGDVEWHVQRAGSGPVMVLVHGTGASTHSWRGVLPILAGRYDVIAMDLPGHAFSSALPIERMTMRSMAGALAELLGVLGAKPSVVVGHSAGAAILARMAIDEDADADLLVSINGALLPFRGLAGRMFSPTAKLFAQLGFWPEWMARRARRTDVTRRLIAGMGSTLDEAGIELYTLLARTPGHVEAALNMMASWDLRELERDLPRLCVPLLMIVGGRDRAIPPEDARRVRSLVHGASVVGIRDGGHLVHEELPFEISQLIIEKAREKDLEVSRETR